MSAINFTGLASGIDTRAIIDAIINAERQPIERLREQQAVLGQRKGALDALRNTLQGFEKSLRDLSSSSTFRARTSTVSDETVLSARAGTGAEPGLYDLTVTSLATADKYVSSGLVSPDQGLVSDGTITIQSGTNDEISIDVSANAGNNSLESVRDAINAADAGVNAAIVFDGTDYLLSVRATETGTANALTITDTTNLDLDTNPPVSTAANAVFNIDGIDITSSSNVITDAIPGVTLDLRSATDAGDSVTVEVDTDNEGVVKAVQDIVDQYNELIDFFNAQENLEDPEQSGPLANDSLIRGIRTDIQSLFTSGVDGIPLGEIRAISSLGVSFDGFTGRATLDSSELQDLLDTNYDDVGDLFTSSGSSSDDRIRYSSSTGSTLTGDYAVTVTQAAEQASLVGTQPITTLSFDETLTIDVGDQSLEVVLSQGDDITAVVDTINAAFRDADIEATATNDAGALRISTRRFGSEASLDVRSSRRDLPTGETTGFGRLGRSDTGLDVEGTIAGVAATGSGQNLRASSDSDAAGLNLRVTATADEVTAAGGDFGTLSFSRGLLSDVIDELDNLTKFNEGVIDTSKDAIDANLERLDDDILRLEERLSSRELRLIATFGEAERAISLLQSQQASISSASFF
ncbi:hypothetical protein ABI59_14435 [Acidobacteria bacterium Mor1]|nr:hypothetical protein ABI59_14435 [Acidobacteria bacterium Mor1]